MRTIEEIKADIEIAFKNKGTDEQRKFILELYETLSANIPFDRLEEICKAERDGRCAVLPCKVGDVVYVVGICKDVNYWRDDDYFTGTGAIECPCENDCEYDECIDTNKKIFETTLKGVWYDEEKTEILFDNLKISLSINDFGKTVFLTKQEAEQALKGGAE